MQDLPVPIIRSKLYPPPAAPDVISRERLDVLAPAVASGVATLISAPAGYGKSTLASQWLGIIGGNAAWLSLDPADSDIRQFVSYLVAALRTVFPACCPETAAILQATRLPGAEELAGAFCNDFAELKAPTVLVLDDYHQISSALVNDFVDALLRRPPKGLHIVILTRRDPSLSFQKLRVSGALTEIRMQHLAFSETEARDVVQRKLGSAIDDRRISRLQERTEGWPAGLRLAMLAAPVGGEAREFVDRIPDDIRAARGYLVDEVLRKCAPSVREYLLNTAFLDRFCAALAEAVCRHDGSDSPEISGAEFIRQINEADLFVIALDRDQQWFRYHHLFQASLQEQAVLDLGEQQIAEIHRRASCWLERQELLEEAVEHAFKAGGAIVAAKLIIRHRNAIMNNEQWHRLDVWLRLLPPEFVASRPELLMLRAWQMQASGSREELGRYLDNIEALFLTVDLDDSTRRELDGSVAALRSFQSYVMSEGHAAIEFATKALALLPGVSLAERGFAAILYGAALQMTGEFSEARKFIFASLSDPFAVGTHSATLRTRLLASLIFVSWMHGDLKTLRASGEEVRALATKADLREALAVANSFEAAICFQHNDPAAALDILREMPSEQALSGAEWHLQCKIQESLAAQALGDRREASRAMESARTMALSARNAYLMEVADAAAAELAVRQGRLAEARLWAERHEPEPLTPMYSLLSPALVLAKILVLDGTEAGHERAVVVLGKIVDYLARTHNNRFLAEALALRALLRETLGQSDTATDDLNEAIALAQPGRFIRLFVDLGPALGSLLSRLELDEEGLAYVGEILAAFRDLSDSGGSDLPAPQAAQSVGVETLSKREQQILRLLAQRLSNKEIAAKLHLSPVTIKRHAANIYQKLGVHSRRQAVAKATGLGVFGKPGESAT